MSEPGIRIVQNRIKERLDTLTGYTIVVDRGQFEPFEASELPAINIRVVAVQFDRAQDGQNGNLAVATIQFDLWSATAAGETIDHSNQVAAATVLQKLYEDFTLGGRLFDFYETGVSGSELDGADAGCAILECEAHFFMPRTNPFVIIGPSGTQFTD